MTKIIHKPVTHEPLVADSDKIPKDIRDWYGDSYKFDHYEIKIAKDPEFDVFHVALKDLNLPKESNVILYHDVVTSRSKPMVK